MATSYPVRCPHCDLVVDSMDSLADSKSDLRYHIKVMHPEVKEG